MGSRIKATANGHSVTINYPHELFGAACYAKAAVKLCEKMNWGGGDLISGCTDKGYVFVFENSDKFTNTAEYK